MCTVMFRFVTWNVCGLSKSINRDNLANKCLNYKMDIACLQGQLIEGPRSPPPAQRIQAHRHGVETLLAWWFQLRYQPTLKQYVKSYGYISDRVAVLDLHIPTKFGAPIIYRIVNAYGPTTPTSTEQPSGCRRFLPASNTAFRHRCI